jgi:hypothetical protein
MLRSDATERKFIVHAQYEGGVSLSISDADAIERAIRLTRQARAVSNA